ncbi:hypothetical protein B0H14DRAFT_3857725 [Mycena olivaceomarginata]|nr:hypothetical protein B0H14DRAFT_3857725 [Mycena olivaceomarginata]
MRPSSHRPHLRQTPARSTLHARSTPPSPSPSARRTHDPRYLPDTPLHTALCSSSSSHASPTIPAYPPFPMLPRPARAALALVHPRPILTSHNPSRPHLPRQAKPVIASPWCWCWKAQPPVPDADAVHSQHTEAGPGRDHRGGVRRRRRGGSVMQEARGVGQMGPTRRRKPRRVGALGAVGVVRGGAERKEREVLEPEEEEDSAKEREVGQRRRRTCCRGGAGAVQRANALHRTRECTAQGADAVGQHRKLEVSADAIGHGTGVAKAEAQQGGAGGAGRGGQGILDAGGAQRTPTPLRFHHVRVVLLAIPSLHPFLPTPTLGPALAPPSLSLPCCRAQDQDSSARCGGSLLLPSSKGKGGRSRCARWTDVVTAPPTPDVEFPTGGGGAAEPNEDEDGETARMERREVEAGQYAQ